VSIPFDALAAAFDAFAALSNPSFIDKPENNESVKMEQL